MSNKEIAGVLKQLARLMELHGENQFRIKSYNNASFQIERYSGSVAELDAKEMASLPGIGKTIVDKINTIVSSGVLPEIDNYLENTPPGVIEIMQIKGIGPKKTGRLWKELEVESPGELLYACNENRLISLKGFGIKTQEQIKAALEFTIANERFHHYAYADSVANEIAGLFQNGQFKDLKLEFCGPYRRKCEVLEALDIVINQKADSIKQLLGGNVYQNWELEYQNVLTCKHDDGLHIKFHICENDTFDFLRFILTGSEAHISQIQHILKVDSIEKTGFSEKNLYQELGMQFIEPELREGAGEIEQAYKNNIKPLIKIDDIKGTLHNHSTYSDGINSLEEMALKCMEMGLQYFGICDHSKSAFYANGMNTERIIEQHKEIDELNSRYDTFKIFKGIESDILHDGSLDYDNDVLESFDFIVASVHSGLKMNIEKATERILKAVENPYTTILGHPTGRLLLAREGYPLDHKRIIDACAENGVVIELNAHPYRLDLDWRWIHYAISRGVMISVNPDAHSVDGLANMYYGVCIGRKGYLTASDTLNCLGVNEITAFFQQSKKKHLST